MKPSTPHEALFEANGTLDFLVKRGLARRPPDPVSAWETFRGFHPSPHMQAHRRRYAPTGPIQLGSRHFLESRGLCRTPPSALGQSALWPLGPCVEKPAASHSCVPGGVPPAKGVGRVELPHRAGSYRGLPEPAEQPGRSGACGTGGHVRLIVGNPPRGVSGTVAGSVATGSGVVPGTLGQSTAGTNVVPGTKGSGGKASAGTVGPAPAPPEQAPAEFAERFFDAHSHLFGVAAGDAKGAGPTPATRGLQGHLTHTLEGMKDRGVHRMVISGKVDPTETPRARNSWDLNRIVEEAWTQNPDFFVPLVNLIIDLDSSDASVVRWDDLAVVDEFLQAHGFRGIGEILVHGHNTNLEDNTDLISLCTSAGAAGVPIVFHWDFGTVDSSSPSTAQDNYDQLERLLDAMDEIYSRGAAGEALDIVICHCGAGPGGAALSDVTTDATYELYEAYATNMAALLARDTTYTKVHFDLAGMQLHDHAGSGVGEVEQLFSFSSGFATPLGDLILELIAAYPDRFMVGLDMDPQGTISSDAHYLVRLMSATLTYLPLLWLASGCPAGDGEDDTKADPGETASETAETAADSETGAETDSDSDTDSDIDTDTVTYGPFVGMDTGIDEVASAKFVGTTDFLGGVSVTVAGGCDFDGDGRNEIVMNAGAGVLVYPGTSAGQITFDDAPTAWSGGAIEVVALAGDVNADGVPDLIAGVPFYDEPGGYNYTSEGKAYLVLGPVEGGGDMEVSAAASFLGPDDVTTPDGSSGTGYSEAGSAVAGAGDVDGDGYDDVLIGAYAADEGYAYLFYGPLGGDYDLDDGGDVRFVGQESGGLDWRELGMGLSGAGDVNGDGFDDVILGGGNADAGALLYLGPLSSGDLTPADADTSFVWTDATGMGPGWNPISAGDLDGDGYPDVAIDWPHYPDSDTYYGAVIIEHAPFWAGEDELSAADAILLGSARDDFASLSLAPAGDLDGDGRADLLVGAPETRGLGSGRAHLVLGDLSGTMDLEDSQVILRGSSDAQMVGWSVAGAGDADGDSLPDLLVTGPGDDELVENGGAVWLVPGSAFR